MKVLVTGIGGEVGLAIAIVLKRHYPECEIIGSDVRAIQSKINLISDYLISPPAENAGFLEWIRQTISDLGITIVVPASDAEVIALLEFGDVGAFVVGPSKTAVDISRDKLVTANFFVEHKIDGPHTQDIQIDNFVSFPLIVKPRSGRGSKDIFVCKNAEELQSLRHNFPESIIQELLLPADAEMTCAVYRSENEGTRVLVMNRKLDGGTTSWVRVVEDDQITRYCERIASCLNLRGSINIQLIATIDGPKAFEINGRFSSTVAMRDQLGFCDLHWSIQDQVFGKSCPYLPPKTGEEVFRNALSNETRS